MTLPVVVAIPGPDEARLLAGWEPLRREVVVVRRCADVADVLAAAGAGLARVVVLGADLPGCDTETVASLQRWRVGLLVLLPAGPDGEQAERRWRSLGVTRFAVAGRPASELAREVALAVVDDNGPTPEAVEDSVAEPVSSGRGRTLAVWGPHGSCGRTTIAVNVAAELAVSGNSVLVVDADTRGAAVGQALGMLDEAPGLLAAVRSAADGRLDAAALQRHLAVAAPDLAVLTGASEPARWSEVRPAAFRRVLEIGSLVHDWTVVDLPGGLDDLGQEGGRDAVTATAAEAADVVLVVGTADPVGLQRFVRAWSRLPELAPEAFVVPVVNRVRSSAVGTPAVRRTTSLLRRLAGVEDVVALPDDVAADTALLAGRTLPEHAARSPLRRALRDLAGRVEVVADAPEDLGGPDGTRRFDPLLARS
ncbi:AAA family ATPase [Kineococcus sp. SYSU DK003]|uniref:AAA family ATPase n=1 Tax=Kineococcus sp. SYSU DK003 TaxID=3383124 RepID=UPI003D7F0FB4